MIRELEKHNKKKIPVTEGLMRPIAARILMKLLYCARMCRYDLMRAICQLASMVTKWDKQCDDRLHRLMR